MFSFDALSEAIAPADGFTPPITGPDASEQLFGRIARRPGRRVLHREHGSRSRSAARGSAPALEPCTVSLRQSPSQIVSLPHTLGDPRSASP